MFSTAVKVSRKAARRAAAVQRASQPPAALSTGAPVQSRLTVGRRGDPLEAQADAVADRVLALPGPSFAELEGMQSRDATPRARDESRAPATAAPAGGDEGAAAGVQAQEEEEAQPQSDERLAAQEEEEAQPQPDERPAAQEDEEAQAQSDERLAGQEEEAQPRSDEQLAAQEDEEEAQAQSDERLAAQEEEEAQARSGERLAAQEEEEAQPQPDEQLAAQEEEEAQPQPDEQLAAQEEEEAQPQSGERLAAQEEEEAQARSGERLAAQEEEEAQPQSDERLAAQEEDEAQPPAGGAPGRSRPDDQPAVDAAGRRLVPPDFEVGVARLRGGGRPFEGPARRFMEARFGASFRGVRLHVGDAAAALARRIRARAFVVGRDVFFASGAYRPETPEGQRLLAHELTHVQQQTGDVRIQGGLHRAPEQVQGFSIAEKLSELAANIPGYRLLTVVMGYEPILQRRVERTATNFLGGFLALVPGGNLLFTRLEESGALDDAMRWLSAEIAKLDISVAGILALVAQAKDEIGWDVRPGNVLAVARRVFGPVVGRLFTFAHNVGAKVMELAFRGAVRLAGGPVERIVALFNKGRAALTALFSDPVGFIKNLFAAVKLGLGNFLKNIKKHLLNGLVGWLFGAIADAGITLPEKFDLKGVFSLVMQILGLTYANIRTKLVKHLGEKTVSRVEKALTFLAELVTRGPIVLWERIKESLANLKQTVMAGIRDFVISRVIREGITWVIGLLNPAGALVKVVKVMVDVVMWLIERWDQITAFANSVFESVSAIAAGTLGPAAKAVEGALGRTVPVIISFLASLLGLGGISGHIRRVIERIRAPIDKAIDKVIGWLVKKARALLAKLKKKAREVAGKVVQWWKARFRYQTSDGKPLEVFFKGKGKSADLRIKASPEKTVDQLVQEATTAHAKHSAEAEDSASPKLEDLRKLRAAYEGIDSGYQKLKRELADQKTPDDAKVAQVESLGKKVRDLRNLMLSIQENESLEGAATRYSANTVKDWYATEMVAFPLTEKGPRGTSPTSSQPGSWGTLKTRRTESGGSSYYIAGHLLNQQLHGRGVWSNMAPISRSANAQHETGVESTVKRKVAALGAKQVVFYRIDVDPGPPAERPANPVEQVREEAAREKWESAYTQRVERVVEAEANLPARFVATAMVVSKPDDAEWPQKDPGLGEKKPPSPFKVDETLMSGVKVPNDVDFSVARYNLGEAPIVLKRLNLSKPGDKPVAAYKTVEGVGQLTAEALDKAAKPFDDFEDITALGIRTQEANALKRALDAGDSVFLNSGKTEWGRK